MRILQSTEPALCLQPSEEQQAFKNSARRFLETAVPRPTGCAPQKRAVEALGLGYFTDGWLTCPDRDCISLCMVAEEFGAADLRYALELLVHLPAIWLLQAAGQDTDNETVARLGIGARQRAGTQRTVWLLLPEQARDFVVLGRRGTSPVLSVGTLSAPAAAALTEGAQSRLPLYGLNLPCTGMSVRTRLTIGAERRHELASACSATLILIAALLVGAMRAAMGFAFGYTSRRKSFDKPLINHQAIAMRLAGMATQVSAMQLLLWRAASTHADDLSECRRLAVQVQQATRHVFPDVAQLCGAHGYVAGLPAIDWFQTGNGLGMMLIRLARSFRAWHTPS